MSTKNEVATDSLIRDSIARQKSVFVPHFRRGSNQMDMFKLQSVEEFCNLQPTLWGIRQPLNPDSKLGWKNFGNTLFLYNNFLISLHLLFFTF